MGTTSTFLKPAVISLFVIFSSVLQAQQLVTGRITDASDGTPIPGASVVVAHTTIGVASDPEGHYSFTVPGRGSFEIVVSHIGYQSVFHKIDTPQDTHQYDVELETVELDEIVVRAAKTYRQSDVNLFWRMILGETPSRRGMEVLNADKIYFYLNNDRVLKALCREPLEIINHHTGYRIRYVLQSFEHDYRTNETLFEGMPSFEELVPRNSREQAQWERKRQEVYAVSMNRFLRALYRKQIREEGFVLADRDTRRNDGKIFPVPLENMLTVGRDETLADFRDPLLLLCYAKPVTNAMISDRTWGDILQNDFPRFMPNIDMGIGMNIPSKVEYSKVDGDAPIVVELLPTQLTVYPNGTYKGTLSLGEINKYMGGLSSKVPVEYPETAQNNLYGLAILPVDGLAKAEDNIIAQLEAYPQEKIHLHTDRDFYIPGEKIWFKAYVIDANSHLYSGQSEYVYVELIGSENTLVNRVLIAQTDDEMCYGYLPVSDMVPEGDYTLRAYTRYMENLGDDYFFKKNIRIGNLTPTLSKGEGALNSTNPINPNREFDVSFFPEGGNLPEGITGRVAFKALQKTGNPETISGTLIDESGVEIASVKTLYAGMGVFEYLPEAGKRYYLKCRNDAGLEKQFELPRSNPRAYTLTVSSDNGNLRIDVRHSARTPDILRYLLVHCRGEVVHFSEWENEPDGFNIAFEDLPAGVIQVVLFDGQMNPLSERLVFNKKDASMPVAFHTDREEYQIRDRIVSTLSFPDFLFLSRKGHFSIAVTDDRDIAPDESVTILSSLLLSSELKGYIANPAYYLRDEAAMDLLMMTHGWRRYHIPEVVKGRLETPRIPFQQYQAISGQVRTASNILNRPVRDSEILVTMKGGGFGVTSTDGNGLFSMSDLTFPDSTSFHIRALDRNGRDNVRIMMDNESFPALVYALQSPLSRLNSADEDAKETSDVDAFMAKAEQRAQFDEDIWALQLEEVTVTASRIRRNTAGFQSWANASADRTITRATFETYHFDFVVDYLRMMPEISVVQDNPTQGAEVYFAGTNRNLIVGKDEMKNNALVFVDGIDVTEEGSWVYLKVTEIENINIFSGVGATIFGMRGANGVVSITTKSGGDLSMSQTEKPNQIVYTPLGYQKPVEFYSPKYETWEARQSPMTDYRTTIFWKPDVVISDEGEAVFDFYSSDFPTTYSVVIEGITDDGKIVRQVEKIRIR